MASRKTSEASSPLSSTSEEKEGEEQEEYEEEEVEEEEVIVEEEVEEEEERVGVLDKEEAFDGGSGASLAGSLNNLRSVNNAMSEFFRLYDGLQQALDAIRTSIEEKIENLNALRPRIQQVNQAPDPQMEEKPVVQEEDRRSELEIICDAMGSRALRRYVASRLSDVERLREEVPAALQRAPNPSKLVLGCMGRFYLQGSKAYSRESEMVSSRRSCVLILEFYLLSGCAAMKEDVFEEAKVGALAWKARILSEGGYSSASEIDALGLILFLASFGVPPEFGTRAFYALLQRCNLNSKVKILRRSTILIDKMPEILKDMLSNKMDVEAVDLACSFGFEKEFPPIPLLSSFLDKRLRAATGERKGQSSLKSQKELNAKELAVLNSVVKCLEDHKLNQSQLTHFEINKKIAKLEKDISNAERKLKERNLKRKAAVAGSLNAIETQTKRPWPATANVSHGLPLRLDHGTSVPSESRGRYNDPFSGNKPYQHRIEPLGLNIHGPAAVGSSLPAVATGGPGHPDGSNIGSLRNTIGQPFGHTDTPYTTTANTANQDLSGLPYTAGNDFPQPYGEKSFPAPSVAAGQSIHHYQSHLYGYGTHGSSSNMYQFTDTVIEQQQAYYDQLTYSAQQIGTNSTYPPSYQI
ncbi:hypothetical protein DsansV1_C04g0040411 [Dioscorea sansibarensis]